MSKLKLDARVRPALGAFVLAPILWLQPQTMGLGVYAIQQSFLGSTGTLVIRDMLPMMVLKLVATVVSIVVGFSGGVFAPSLFMGSLLGSSCAMAAAKVGLVTAPAAVFAMAGMGAMVATVFGAPIFAVIIVLEMTACFPATTMVLVAVTSSYLLSHQLFAESLFHYQDIRDEEQRGRTLSYQCVDSVDTELQDATLPSTSHKAFQASTGFGSEI